jgi:hypothetical protein
MSGTTIIIKLPPGLAEWLLSQPDPAGEALMAIINHRQKEIHPMSRENYMKSLEVSQEPFEVMRIADDHNLRYLKFKYPHIWEELQTRYNAPGGHLPEETHNP